MGHSLKISENGAGKEGVLVLMGNVTIMEALETKEKLLEAIKEVDVLHVDVQAIESVDVTFIQLLCAAHRECFLSKKEVFLQGDLVDTLEEFLERAGYSKHHGCIPGAQASCLWCNLQENRSLDRQSINL